MQKNTYRLLTEKFGISEKVLELIGRAEEKAAGKFAELDDIRAYNQYKVLDIFRKSKTAATVISPGIRATDMTTRAEKRLRACTPVSSGRRALSSAH